MVRASYLGTNRCGSLFGTRGTTSATNQANYVFTNGLPVARVTLNSDLASVDLTTGPLAFGSNYLIVVNISGTGRDPQLIAVNTPVPLLATPYIPEGIGAPTPPGTVVGLPDGYDLAGGGRDIGYTTDQFQHFYQVQQGDFDVKVRLNSLSQTDPFAEAGLMARADLTASSRFAATLATPSLSGSCFLSRATSGGAAASSGSLPVNYPYTWLASSVPGISSPASQLRRNRLAAIGSPEPAHGRSIYLGMAVSSHNVSQAAVAQFRDIATVTNATTGMLALPSEPAGPSSRRTGLAITEIMYHPAERPDGKQLEFVESSIPSLFKRTSAATPFPAMSPSPSRPGPF